MCRLGGGPGAGLTPASCSRVPPPRSSHRALVRCRPRTPAASTEILPGLRPRRVLRCAWFAVAGHGLMRRGPRLGELDTEGRR